jgi:hypothetical protein
MKRHIDKYDEDDLLDHPDLEDAREAAASERVRFLGDVALGSDTSRFVQRFSSDKLFRRMVAPRIASDMEFEPPPSSFSGWERALDEEAFEDEVLAVEEAFSTRHPTPEQLKTREERWAYVMKTYGLPAVDFVTWEVL